MVQKATREALLAAWHSDTDLLVAVNDEVHKAMKDVDAEAETAWRTIRERLLAHNRFLDLMVISSGVWEDSDE